MKTRPRFAHTLGISFALVGLLLAACADDATTTSTIPPTSASSTTSAVGSTSSSLAAESTTSIAQPESTTTTAASSSTSTTVLEGDPNMVLTQLVFGSVRYLIITNVGQGPGSLGGFWLCQRPGYFELPDAELGPGEAAAVVVGGGELPDLIGVTQMIDAGNALGVLDPKAGDIGFFTEPSFSDPDAIIGYVRWGDSVAQGRTDTAVAAGIWEEGGTVAVTEGLLAITITNLPAASSEDWVADIGV